MKKYLLFTLFIALTFIGTPQIFSQKMLKGTVAYQQIDKFNFEPTGRLEWDQYAKTLPSEFKFEKLLHFDASKSLFEDSPNPNMAPLSRRERRALHMSKYGKKPQPTPQKIYCDFEKEEMTEVLDFMTRAFLVESPIEKRAWKFLNTPKKIMDYTCMAAETTIDFDVITAWFTPQIPVPAGPEIYNGLPGMILAVEKNGETIFLATSIELNPEEDLLTRPKEGKKVSRKKLDQIIDEKVEEFKSAQGTGKGHFRGRGH